MKYIISGYFLAFHTGHKEYINSAKKLLKENDELIIIVNNEYQQELKYGFVPRDPNDIVLEIEEFAPDAKVIISKSMDRTICDDLIELYSYDCTFVKDGGEYNEKNLPEAYICKRLGIQMLFLNNNKIASSSCILGIRK